MSSDETAVSSTDGSESHAISAEVLDAMQRMAIRYYSHGMYSDSVCLLEFLLRHRSNRADTYFSLGKAKHAQTEYADAITNYKRSVLLGLSDIEVHLYIGQCFIFLRRLAQAAAALRDFLTLANADRSYRNSPLLASGQHLLTDLVLPQLNSNTEGQND